MKSAAASVERDAAPALLPLWMVSGVCRSVSVQVDLDCRRQNRPMPLRRFEGSEKWAGAQQISQNTVGGDLVPE